MLNMYIYELFQRPIKLPFFLLAIWQSITSLVMLFTDQQEHFGFFFDLLEYFMILLRYFLHTILY